MCLHLIFQSDQGGGCSAKAFEGSAVGKAWSVSNMSFAGVYSLVGVGIEQYMVDYLHLTLHIVPFLFSPIVAQVFLPYKQQPFLHHKIFVGRQPHGKRN